MARLTNAAAAKIVGDQLARTLLQNASNEDVDHLGNAFAKLIVSGLHHLETTASSLRSMEKQGIVVGSI